MQEHEFNRIYREYSRQLYTYALWMTGKRSASDDVLQTVFLRVWQGARIPTEEPALKAWLYTVCRNTCLDHFRAASRSARFRVRYAKEHASFTVEAMGEGLIWQKLMNLGETDRTIVYMHIRLGWGYGDIAGLLKTTENNVRVRAFRALRKLRGAFTEKT